MKTKFTSKDSSLFGSVQKVKEESKISRFKVKHFLHTQPAETKYRTVRRKTPRPKVIIFDIDKVLSIGLAYLNKLADYNKNNKYLMVAMDYMSRYLCLQPLKSKYHLNCVSIQKNIKIKRPKNNLGR